MLDGTTLRAHEHAAGTKGIGRAGRCQFQELWRQAPTGAVNRKQPHENHVAPEVRGSSLVA
jgi:hypothetical protein